MTGAFYNLVHSPRFEAASAILIGLNTIAIAFEVQYAGIQLGCACSVPSRQTARESLREGRSMLRVCLGGKPHVAVLRLVRPRGMRACMAVV